MKEAKEQYVRQLRFKRAEQNANKLISIELGQRQGEQWYKIKLKRQAGPEKEWLCPKDNKKSLECLERGIRLSALHFLRRSRYLQWEYGIVWYRSEWWKATVTIP